MIRASLGTVRILPVLALVACYDPELSDLSPEPQVDGWSEAPAVDATAIDGGGSLYLCDAPEDCPGQECCANPLPAGGSSCQDSCPGGTAEVCNSLADCVCGPCDSCGDDPDPVMPNYDLPVCYDN